MKDNPDPPEIALIHGMIQMGEILNRAKLIELEILKHKRDIEMGNIEVSGLKISGKSAVTVGDGFVKVNGKKIDSDNNELVVLLDAIHLELVEINAKQPSLRDQFAMAAMTGMLSGRPDLQLGVAARHCYIVADAMLAAREAMDE